MAWMDDTTAFCAFVTLSSLFLSWLLSLLATASVPITKSIFMLKIATADDSFTLATAGAFGLCYPGGNHQYMDLNLTIAHHCTGHMVGYALNKTLLGSGGDISNVIPTPLSAALILNALHCALVGVAVPFVIWALMDESYFAGLYAAVLLYVGNAIGWAAWSVDLALSVVARQRILSNATVGNLLEVRAGHGVWLELAAVVFSSLALATWYQVRMIDYLSAR